MKRQTGRNHSRGACLSPTDFALLKDPLAFIAEDHLREREVCAVLDRIAGGDSPEQQDVSCVTSFLNKELPLHLADEEEDLFPLMRRCCTPEDEMDRIINRLLLDHQHAVEDTPVVAALLQELQSRALSDEERQLLSRFAAHARRHLILENAVILPIARLRLSETDVESLRLRMAQRRGTKIKKDNSDAE